MANSLPVNPSTISPAEQKVREVLRWIRSHNEQALAMAGLFLLVVALVAFMIHHHQIENEEAWNQLGVTQGQLMQGQTAETRQSLDTWEQRFKGSNAATYARFLRADLLYRTSDYATAATTYSDLAVTGRPDEIRPLALAAQSYTEEMAGHLPQAQAAAKEFIERYPDHFMAASMYLAQARLMELTGNTAGASVVYDRFAILYPQSPWTAFAKSRGPSSAAPTKLPNDNDAKNR